MNKVLAAMLAMLLAACTSIPPAKHDQARAIAESNRDRVISCQDSAGCGLASPFTQLQQLPADTPTTDVILLDQGQDALIHCACT
jgi:hypothetical protein